MTGPWFGRMIWGCFVVFRRSVSSIGKWGCLVTDTLLKHNGPKPLKSTGQRGVF